MPRSGTASTSPGTQSLTKAAIRSDSPYNSRRFPGLPPTPIANPGLAFDQGSGAPAAVDYLYYVRIRGTRRHFFTASESEFLRKGASSATPATDGPLREGGSTLATWLSPVFPAVSRSRRRPDSAVPAGRHSSSRARAAGRTSRRRRVLLCVWSNTTRRHARAADGDEREERRIVSVLFADLAGLTALGERLDPEEVREVQGELFALVNGHVERFGGVTENPWATPSAMFGIRRRTRRTERPCWHSSLSATTSAASPRGSPTGTTPRWAWDRRQHGRRGVEPRGRSPAS